MEIVSRLLLIFVLNIFVLNILCTMPGYAAPLLNAKEIWSRNVFVPVIKACSPDGQCWGWLPKSETYDNTNIIVPKQDSDTSRLQSRRQIANPVSEIMLGSWKDSMSEEAGREIRAPLPVNKQIPIRTTKKDLFMSRGWGAGGMPFSVLYMNPRSNHAVTATSPSQRQETGATTESSTPFVEHPNSRIAPRNSQSTVQPRRQYWTIPQLFISYGWAQFGK